METATIDAAKPARRRITRTEPSIAVTELMHDAIAVRAYELFLERGCAHGNDLDDWLRAEQELIASGTGATLLTRELIEKPAS